MAGGAYSSPSPAQPLHGPPGVVRKGQITRRFENVSPLANLGPALRGETVKPTAVVRRNREGQSEARGQKTLVQPLLQQVGINLRHYRATELLEQEYKSRAAALNTIVEQMMLSDPEFRELMTGILGEMAGTPFEGLRTLDPSGATAQLRAVEFEDI